MKPNLGAKLKELRKTENLTAEDVSEKLKKMGYDIAGKTLSGYENGIRMPNADVFMALMSVYNCKNVLETFSFVEADYSIPTDFEWNLIEKYRSLDPYGKETVDLILERESSRSAELQKQSKRIAELETPAPQANVYSYPFRTINYYYRLASAGTGQIVFDAPPTKRIDIPDLPEYRRADYAIGVNGSSMEPTFSDGDTLLVEMTEEIDLGEIGIFLVDNESYVKKLGHRELISLNPEASNIPLTENSKCMGRVLGKLEKG